MTPPHLPSPEYKKPKAALLFARQMREYDNFRHYAGVFSAIRDATDVKGTIC